jgi:hypothetical protein
MSALLEQEQNPEQNTEQTEEVVCYDDLYIEYNDYKTDEFEGYVLEKNEVIYPKQNVISNKDCALCIKNPSKPVHYIYAPLNRLDKKLFHDTIQAIRALNLPVSENRPTYFVLTLNKYNNNKVVLPEIDIETNKMVMYRHSPDGASCTREEVGSLHIWYTDDKSAQEQWERCSVCGYIIPYDLQHYRKKTNTSDCDREKAERVLWCEQCYRATEQSGVKLDVEPRIESTGMGNIRDYVYMFAVMFTVIASSPYRYRRYRSYYCNLNPLSEHYGRYAVQQVGDVDSNVFQFETGGDCEQRGVSAALSILRRYM